METKGLAGVGYQLNLDFLVQTENPDERDYEFSVLQTWTVLI